MTGTPAVAGPTLLALPRESLAALRNGMLTHAPDAFASCMQSAGYAGGAPVWEAFRAWNSKSHPGDADSLSLDLFGKRVSEFFTASGWGKLTIASLHDVVAAIDCTEWAECDASLGAEYPTCHFSTGLFADLFGRVGDTMLAALEVECCSAGSGRCRFLLGSEAVLSAIYEQMVAGTSYEDAIASLAAH